MWPELCTSTETGTRKGTNVREVFQQELREVQERLVEIAHLVAVSIDNATRAFNESNVSLAEQVIADDDKIDVAALELDELAINILARQQPVARDLRIVVSALRISASLERMGDMAEHIAQLLLEYLTHCNSLSNAGMGHQHSRGNDALTRLTTGVARLNICRCLAGFGPQRLPAVIGLLI